MRYIFTISRSRSFCQSQGHMRKNDNFTYFNMLIFINKVKVTHQGEGYIKVKYLHPLCSPYSLQAGGLHSTECVHVSFSHKIFWDNRCGHWSLLVTLYVFLSSFNQIMGNRGTRVSLPVN